MKVGIQCYFTATNRAGTGKRVPESGHFVVPDHEATLHSLYRYVARRMRYRVDSYDVERPGRVYHFQALKPRSDGCVDINSEVMGEVTITLHATPPVGVPGE